MPDQGDTRGRDRRDGLQTVDTRFEVLTPVLKSPEIVAAVSRQTGIRPTDIMNKFDDGFWNELTPTEKQRLMQIMVEHVTVNEDGVMIVFRTENIKSIQEANIEQNP